MESEKCYFPGERLLRKVPRPSYLQVLEGPSTGVGFFIL